MMATVKQSRPGEPRRSDAPVPPILVTRIDLERLHGLLETHATRRDQQAIDFLDAELARARVVEPSEMPRDVVTMNSRFRYIDCATGASRIVTLVYPTEADAAAGRLSVLAPVGCALLGLSVGQTIEWALPNGRLRSFAVSDILYQPESSGDHRL